MVGPPGLKGFVDAMGVIVKRRYPELVVREVEEVGTVALHEQLIMKATPIRSVNVSISVYLYNIIMYTCIQTI